VVDGRKVGTWTESQFAAGINISSATVDAWEPGGPWDAQANVVLRLTDSRSDLEMGRMMADLFSPRLNGKPEWKADAAELNSRIEALQHEAARPVPYHFVVQPAIEEKKPEK
jgi:hypothetical protein